MKKLSLLTSLFLLIGVFTMSSSSFATDDSTNKEERTSKYAKVSGEIVDLNEEEGVLRMIVEDDRELQTIFPLPDEVGLYTNSGKRLGKQDLEKGMKVDAFYDDTVARIMIYPMIITPELVVVQTEEEPGQVRVGKFDENLLSYEGDLTLKISDETVLVDKNGEPVTKEELAHQELAVFYSVVLESYPAQTKPEMVILLDREEEPADSMFAKVHGNVTSIEETEKHLRVSIEDEQERPNILLISDESTLLYTNTGEKMSKEEIKEGMKIEAYFDKSKPQILIYPPTFSPEIAIVYMEEEPGFVKVGRFDENLVSHDNELKLQISEETILLNEAGETITKEELANKELIVFYTNSTKSIPAQTTPEKVIALNMMEQEEPKEAMIPIREVAEGLGYEVTWDHDTQSVDISSPSLRVHLSIGEKEYIVNGRTFTFNSAPELVNGKTLVSNVILKSLNP